MIEGAASARHAVAASAKADSRLSLTTQILSNRMLGFRGKWGQPRSEAVPSGLSDYSDSAGRPRSGNLSLLLLLACFVFLLPALSKISLGLIGFYALILLLVVNRAPCSDLISDWAAFLLGFLIVLAPVAGAYAVTCLSILFLIHAHRFELSPEAKWLGPILLVYGLWAGATFYFEFDPKWFEEVANFAARGGASWLGFVPNFIAISDCLSNVPPRWYSIIAFWILWYCGALLVSVFSQARQRGGGFDGRGSISVSFVRGLIPGILVSGLVALLQIRYLGYSLTNNQSAFWNDLSRIPATFSDPNAFGIFGFLSVVLVCAFAEARRSWQRALLYGLAALWVAIISYSGSRSFVLGLFLFASFFILSKVLVSKRGIWAALGGATTIILIVVFVPVASLADLTWLPQSFKRVLATISSGQSLNDSLFSRLSFFKIDLAVWSDHFLLGAGLRRFSELVPVYSSRLGLATGLWSDNSNSFYLGLLAETGIVGLAALFISVLGLRRRSLDRPGDDILTCGLSAFLVLLIVGPHLDFEEVMVAACCLIGSIFMVRITQRQSGIVWIAGLLCCAFIPAQVAFMPYGLFAWEKDGSHYFRWSQVDAQFWIPCNQDHLASLSLRSLAPNLAKEPQIVAVKVSSNERFEIVLDDSSTKTRLISCFAGSGTRTAFERVLVKVQVSRGWIPSKVPGAGDSRLLGVQIISPDIG